MSPESPGNLISLDLILNNSRLECQVDRYDNGGGFLYVSWNAIECPEYYVPVSNDVAYVWVPNGFTHRQYRARIDSLEDGYEWVDVAQSPSGAMLIITLPPNYLYIHSNEDTSFQNPVRFKSTQSKRMALYWWIEPGRFEIAWKMKYSPEANIEDQTDILNREARRRKQPSAYPVHIDRPLDQGANSPSYQSEILNEPPSWVSENQTYYKSDSIPDRQTLTQLRKLLIRHFNIAELRVLCFDVDVDYEELEGSNKTTKMQNLISHLQRRNELHLLIREAKEQRPSVKWPDIKSSFTSSKNNPNLNKTELLVYSTSKQETYLRIIPDGLEIHVKEKQPGKEDRRVTLSVEEASIILLNEDISIRPNYTKNSGLFNLGRLKKWYYSHWIFKDPQELRDALENILQILVSQ